MPGPTTDRAAIRAILAHLTRLGSLARVAHCEACGVDLDVSGDRFRATLMVGLI